MATRGVEAEKRVMGEVLMVNRNTGTLEEGTERKRHVSTNGISHLQL